MPPPPPIAHVRLLARIPLSPSDKQPIMDERDDDSWSSLPPPLLMPMLVDNDRLVSPRRPDTNNPRRSKQARIFVYDEPGGSMDEMGQVVVGHWVNARKSLSQILAIVFVYTASKEVKTSIKELVGVLSDSNQSPFARGKAKASLLWALQDFLPELEGYGRRGDLEFHDPRDFLGKKNNIFPSIHEQNEELKKYILWKKLISLAALSVATFYGLKVPTDDALIREEGREQLDKSLIGLLNVEIGQLVSKYNIHVNLIASDRDFPTVDTAGIKELIKNLSPMSSLGSPTRIVDGRNRQTVPERHVGSRVSPLPNPRVSRAAGGADPPMIPENLERADNAMGALSIEDNVSAYNSDGTYSTAAVKGSEDGTHLG